jgi:hypothetical protein
MASDTARRITHCSVRTWSFLGARLDCLEKALRRPLCSTPEVAVVHPTNNG